MKNIMIGSGEEVTQEKFIELNSDGLDRLTEFLATSADVQLLGEALARKVVGLEWLLSQCVDRDTIAEHNYLIQRLGRVVDFMPELENEIKEILKVERLKNKIDLGDWSLPANPGCPKCFSPLDRQLAVLNNLHYAICVTAEGKWELGELEKSKMDFMAFSAFRCTDCGNNYASFHPRNAHEVAAWEADQAKKQDGAK